VFQSPDTLALAIEEAKRIRSTVVKLVGEDLHNKYPPIMVTKNCLAVTFHTDTLSARIHVHPNNYVVEHPLKPETYLDVLEFFADDLYYPASKQRLAEFMTAIVSYKPVMTNYRQVYKEEIVVVNNVEMLVATAQLRMGGYLTDTDGHVRHFDIEFEEPAKEPATA
jgi:hypothetical protein